MMAQYRALQDCYLAGAYYLAGDTITLSNNFIPPGAVDPLDAPAVTAFFNAGPQLCGLIRPQWSGQVVGPPVTRWVPGPGAYQWSLTGLGAGMVTSGGPMGLP
jgi:hypothetical protein